LRADNAPSTGATCQAGMPRMNWTSTVWRLVDTGGRAARCLVGERAGGWQVILWHQRGPVLWERHASGRDAWARADELRACLLQFGWRPADPPLLTGAEARACPHCRQRQAVLHRGCEDELGFLCGACGHRWCSNERLATRDRRESSRPLPERRHPGGRDRAGGANRDAGSEQPTGETHACLPSPGIHPVTGTECGRHAAGVPEEPRASDRDRVGMRHRQRRLDRSHARRGPRGVWDHEARFARRWRRWALSNEGTTCAQHDLRTRQGWMQIRRLAASAASPTEQDLSTESFMSFAHPVT
jgi:hypothetical protein